MQTVGKLQAVTPVSENLTERIDQVLNEWVSRKFDQSDGNYPVVRHSGKEAIFDRSQHELGDAKLSTLDVLEPIEGGQLQTKVQLLTANGQIHFNCQMAIDADGGLAPPDVDLFVPRFVRNVISLSNGWMFPPGGERIFSHNFNVGLSDVETFISLLQSPQRRLPLVVISEFEGRTISGDLHVRVASDLCGLGHTCKLDRDAAWAMTDRLDKDWSVYNGGVRLFWPLRANRENPRNHPLWTYDFLTRRGGSEIEIRDKLRRTLRERLLEASTFLSDDPAFATFHRALDRSQLDQAKATNPAANDALQAEIKALRDELDAKDSEIATLRSNVEALMIASRSRDRAEADVVEEETPPATVAEALDMAQRRYRGRLRFGDDLSEHVVTLNPEAGPPDKILRYLGTLADMSDTLAAGPLGKSIPMWLRDNGVEASGESETVKGNRDAQRRRRFRFSGEPTYCEFHAKPSDGVSPDLCARIYFAIGEDEPRVRIGYVGRHFD